MTGVQALLVDLDGTLVDTREANYLAYADALEAVGVTLDRATFDNVATGLSWRQFLPILMRGVPDADPAAVAARKAHIYPAKLEGSMLNRALIDLIGTMRVTCKTALVTTASAVNARAVLDHHAIADLFDIVVTGNDVDRHKPDPQAYEIAGSRLGVGADACIAFEDSDVGVAAAIAFGARCIRIRFPD